MRRFLRGELADRGKEASDKGKCSEEQTGQAFRRKGQAKKEGKNIWWRMMAMPRTLQAQEPEVSLDWFSCPRTRYSHLPKKVFVLFKVTTNSTYCIPLYSFLSETFACYLPSLADLYLTEIGSFFCVCVWTPKQRGPSGNPFRSFPGFSNKLAFTLW